MLERQRRASVETNLKNPGDGLTAKTTDGFENIWWLLRMPEFHKRFIRLILTI